MPDPGTHLDIATPERVALDLPVAGIGYRSLAYLVDLLVLFAAWVVAYFIFSLLTADPLGAFHKLSGLGQVLVVLGAFATQWIFWIACEVWASGRTLGKRLLRIRVVRDDGSPVGLFESALRNLARVVDFLPALYAVGICSLLLTRPHRRLGDLLAGTVVIREETADLDQYRLAQTPATGRAALAPSEVELLLDFLRRAPSLEVAARDTLASRLVDRFGGDLEPQAREALRGSWEATERFLRERASGAA